VEHSLCKLSSDGMQVRTLRIRLSRHKDCKLQNLHQRLRTQAHDRVSMIVFMHQERRCLPATMRLPARLPEVNAEQEQRRGIRLAQRLDKP
jgi:hypothetical protein